MTGFGPDELSRDAFLGGMLHLHQPVKGYRAGVDPVLLAASVNAKSGQNVLELGCGAGQALLCLASRVSDLSLAGVELQPEYAELASRNAADNGFPLDVFCADLADIPVALRQQSFEHVLMNPPYYRKGAHSSASDPGRAQALGEDTPLEIWFDVAARRLKPRGYLHVIQRTERLPEMLGHCEGRLGSVEVLPLISRNGKIAELVLMRARKEGRAPFKLHGPFVMHEGDRHEADAESYRPEVSAILRAGAPLHWPS
ncbi:MAG: tRNA1(Val) (adenine(37)-N6)-methyltransferase [Paracoccaceae bacterium]